MNEERINELQKFAEEFNKMIEESHITYYYDKSYFEC